MERIADPIVHRFTVEEYMLAAGAGAFAGRQVELLDGLVVDMSPSNTPHYAPIWALTQLLAARLETLRIQHTLHGIEYWLPEPDVAVMELDAEGVLQTRLVIEVVVTTHREMRLKTPGYALAGRDPLWIVDVPKRLVRVLSEPIDDEYVRSEVLRGDDLLDPRLDGVKPFSVAELFELADRMPRLPET